MTSIQQNHLSSLSLTNTIQSNIPNPNALMANHEEDMTRNKSRSRGRGKRRRGGAGRGRGYQNTRIST